MTQKPGLVHSISELVTIYLTRSAPLSPPSFPLGDWVSLWEGVGRDSPSTIHGAGFVGRDRTGGGGLMQPLLRSSLGTASPAAQARQIQQGWLRSLSPAPPLAGMSLRSGCDCPHDGGRRLCSPKCGCCCETAHVDALRERLATVLP